MPNSQDSDKNKSVQKHDNERLCSNCTLDRSVACTSCKLEDAVCSSCGHDHGHAHDKTDWRMTIIIGIAIAIGIFLDYFGIGGILSTIIFTS